VPDLEYQRALHHVGKAAVTVIRAAVAETEAEWARELGPKRFTQLRTLLHELNHHT
jgi:ATP-dependent Clp protease adapter protein ClpS